MFRVPDLYHDISLKLSSVLEEIGVNERVILKKRRSVLLGCTLEDITNQMQGSIFAVNFFGSYAEGTTTQGLHSDIDVLIYDNKYIVIQDWEEWEPGLGNLLMIQDETTPPGYCMLQLLHSNVPTAVNKIIDAKCVRYRGDRILLKNTYKNILKPALDAEMNGPAWTSKHVGFTDQDLVIAFPLKTLPQFLRTWLQQQAQQGNISQEMKRYIESKPCFVVPVGRKDSFEEAQWRISTSYAEKCRMFSLNITQLQCYVLLKLILKTYLTHLQEKLLSSFMCKNILLLCIDKTHPSKWCPQNLLSVFTLCLRQLKRSVQRGYCPHFVMSENNLLAGKLTPKVKDWLLEKIQYIYDTHGCAFLGVEIDRIGLRLVARLNIPNIRICVTDEVDISSAISASLHYNLAIYRGKGFTFPLQKVRLGNTSFNAVLTTLQQLYHHGSYLEQAASRLLTPLFCSTVGSVIASRDIHYNQTVSPEALNWLSIGQNSDVASSRLKMASVYYCAGDFITTETLLSNIAQVYDQDLVEAACFCYQDRNSLSARLPRFAEYANTHDELSIRHIFTYCVRFIPEEVYCQPPEMRYEMYRSTPEERSQRCPDVEFWMDWAVADSLPYLYFLQYKTYGHLQKYDEQRQALNNFVKSISKEDKYHQTDNYHHRETALNLLGQIYQQENRYTEAFLCYMASLKVRPTNNAAKLNLCRLLYAMNSN